MAKKIFVEGALFFLTGGLGIVEGLRVGLQGDAQAIQGLVGPGAYVLFPSFLLMITGAVYLYNNYKNQKAAAEIKSQPPKKRSLTLGIILVLGLYIALIDLCGYLIASAVFFILQFKMLGVESWLKIFILTGIIVMFNYFIFIDFCSMSLPHGILFK